MTPMRQCEFYLLRYVPDAVKDEFVNVGVVLVDAGAGWAEVRLTHDWRRVQCLDADADLDVLEGMETELREQLRESPDARAEVLRRLQEALSGVLRMTEAKAVLTESPAEELGRLADLYLERKRSRLAGREASGRAQILSVMRGEFERHGVWRLLRHNVAAAEYTHRGDPLRLDCAYRPNGTVHFYQAVSLAAEVNTAKALAFSYPRLREGVARVEKAETVLTAVTESELQEAESVSFARQTLREAGIVLATTAEMPRIAESVRQQLGLD